MTPPGWPPQGAPPGWPPQGPPLGWPPPPGAPPWAMAPVMVPVYMAPPPRPLPSRDRLLAAVLIGDAVLGPLAIIGIAIAGSGFGPNNGPGSLGFKLAGLVFALFFLSIAAAPVVLRDLAGQAAPRALGPAVVITVLTLAALSVVVGVIFTTSGAAAPPALPLAGACFTASSACLLAVNLLMLRTRATSMAVPALGVVFAALSLTGGLLLSVALLSQFGGVGFGARIAAGFLVVGGFVCYLIWAVMLGIAVLRRPVLQRGQTLA